MQITEDRRSETATVESQIIPVRIIEHLQRRGNRTRRVNERCMVLIRFPLNVEWTGK